MIYLLHDKAGDAQINLEGEAFKHIVKARRAEVGDTLLLRRLDDTYNHFYRFDHSSKNEALLTLEKSEPTPAQMGKKLHLGWCMVDPKSIEKALPSLSELGVSKISFIYAKRSQKQFKIDHKRLERILLNSMQQSGRYEMMQIETDLTLESFIVKNPDALVLDFCDQALKDEESFETVILGPEGGFSEEEKALLSRCAVRRLDTPLILRSETAALAIASKLLL